MTSLSANYIITAFDRLEFELYSTRKKSSTLLDTHFTRCHWAVLLFALLDLHVDLHVTLHRVQFLTIKPTRCTDFSNLFLELNSTCCGQFLCPSPGIFHCSHSNGIYHTGYDDSLRAGTYAPARKHLA